MAMKPTDLSDVQGSPQKIVVGSEEWCAFPGFGIPAIVARVDSGARTSSIHAFNIQPFSRKGQDWVSFEVHPLQQNRRLLVRCEAPVADYRRVKSSSGVAEKRYVIQTILRLWDQEFVIELTLANRDSMGYRMLLGREAMVGRILVDPELSYCLGQVSDEILEQHYKDARRSVDGLRIVLLADNEKYYTNRRLIEACEERGHFPAMLNVRSCFLSLDSVRGEIYERDRGIVPSFDAMIPRFSIEETLFGAGLVRQYLMNGGVALNNPDALVLSRHKLSLLQKMVASDVPICSFGFAYAAQDLELLTKKVGYEPYSVQLTRHYQVKSSIHVSTTSETAVLARAWQKSDFGAMIQGRSAHAERPRIRALVVNGRVISVVLQESLKLTQTATDFTGYENYQLSKEEKKFVLRVAKISGLSFLSVDFIRGQQDEHSCFLSDVVASPSIEVFEKATGKDIATQIVIEIERVCDWQQKHSEI